MSNSELTDLIVSLQNEEKASLLTEGNAHVPSMQPLLKKKKKMQSLTTSCSMAREQEVLDPHSQMSLHLCMDFTHAFCCCSCLKPSFSFLRFGYKEGRECIVITSNASLAHCLATK